MKAFIIYLPAYDHSAQHANNMQTTLKDYGIDVELYPGVDGITAVNRAFREHKTLYPYGIKRRKLSADDLRHYINPAMFDDFIRLHDWEVFQKLEPSEEECEKMSLPGVVGCFYSHYELWQKCAELNEPIMIFEDDVKFYRNYQPVEFEDVLVLSLGKSSFMEEPQKTWLESPTGTPQALPWKNFSMPGNSGYAIKPHAARRLVKKWRPYWYPADNAINNSICTIQIHNHLMGRNTLFEEGNVSMTRLQDWS